MHHIKLYTIYTFYKSIISELSNNFRKLLLHVLSLSKQYQIMFSRLPINGNSARNMESD